MRIPRAVCSLRSEYVYIGHVISYSNIYDMTESEFIKAVMRTSGGGMNIKRIKQIYRNLMEDAGLEPLIGEK